MDLGLSSIFTPHTVAHTSTSKHMHAHTCAHSTVCAQTQPIAVFIEIVWNLSIMFKRINSFVGNMVWPSYT